MKKEMQYIKKSTVWKHSVDRTQKRVTCPSFHVAEDLLMDVIQECVDGVYQWLCCLFGSLLEKLRGAQRLQPVLFMLEMKQSSQLKSTRYCCRYRR